jgi:hypothetical protein
LFVFVQYNRVAHYWHFISGDSVRVVASTVPEGNRFIMRITSDWTAFDLLHRDEFQATHFPLDISNAKNHHSSMQHHDFQS